MTGLLYKVSEPRDDWSFEPRRFWRAEDWSFSADHPGNGLVEDRVLFAAEFDDINIHLLPRVWRLRVWLDDDERRAGLGRLGYSWAASARAVIFALEADRHAVESFKPTVFAFERSGFVRTPTNEYVSRAPRAAVSAETMSFEEARGRWQFDVVYVVESDALVKTLRSAGVDHQIQT